MKLTSPIFENNGKIPSKYTCDGENTNPSLKIENVPDGTKSLVLIMDDPDVPKNIREDGMWDHWIVFNINPENTEINEGHEPKGIAGVNTSGNLGYQGPCPPDKEHRYFFKVYALDSELELQEGSTKKQVEEAMEDHILDKIELIGLYNRM